MIELVISGGQTGVDEAALIVAKNLGIKTSGWMPKGFRTLDGPKYHFKNLYNMKQHSSFSYAERTADNVLWADFTLRIASKFNSAGAKCTKRAIIAHDKPYYDIDANNPNIEEAVKVIKQHEVKILNVAGNSEQTAPGIQQKAIIILMRLLKQVNEIT